MVLSGHADPAVQPALYIHDAETGEELATYPMPANVIAPPVISGNRLFVFYGTESGAGGVRAYRVAEF